MSHWQTRFLYNAINAAFLGFATPKLMLLNASYTPDPDYDFADDVNAFEVSGTGYTTGGVAVAPATTLDLANDRVEVNFPQIVIPSATIAARYGVCYNDTIGAPSTDPLAFEVDFGSLITSTGGSFTIPPLTVPFRLINPP